MSTPLKRCTRRVSLAEIAEGAESEIVDTRKGGYLGIGMATWMVVRMRRWMACSAQFLTNGRR